MRSLPRSPAAPAAPAAWDDLAARLASVLAEAPAVPSAEMLTRLVAAHLDTLPLPGRGHTLARFRALAAVAAHDLSLAKLYEGHTDALAILAELQAPPPPVGSTIGTWAAEGKDARVALSRLGCTATLHGRKAWCSGARRSTHALLTVWGDAPRPLLALVALDQPAVRIADEGFVAVGMAATESVDVVFTHAAATIVGEPGDYLTRPGFWQGAAGIAACWYGGVLGLAQTLRAKAKLVDDVVLRAHLGHVDAALAGARATLRGAAAEIDERPDGDARKLALRVRAVVEAAVTTSIAHIGRALGAAPFCRDAAFARRAADLPVFLRQSHAEHDLAQLGALLSREAKEDPWAL